MNVPLLAASALFVAAAAGVGPDTARSASICDANDLDEIVAYTAIESSNVPGEFEGADFDKVVKLDNDMVFEFNEFHYTYSFHPKVIIFARNATYQGRSIILYKLLIDDELYDVVRLR